MDFAFVASLITPVFLVIAIGIVWRRLGIFSDAVEGGLMAFVTRLAVPVLLFRVVVTGELPASPPWALWIGYFAGVVVVFPIAMIVMRRVFGREAEVGVIGGVSAGFANTIMVGIPVTVAAYGEEGLVPLSLLLSVHLPVMMLISTICIARFQTGTEQKSLLTHIWETIKTLAQNGLILGLAFGFAARLLGLTPSGPAEFVMNWLADAAIPCALIVLGMSLNQYGVRGNVMPAIILGMMKLFLMPAVVFVVSHYLLPLPTLHANVMTLTAAASTGINAYLIASHFGTGLRISASTITLTTAASVFSLTIWLAILTTVAPV